jgi:transposase, IS5 family
METQMNKPRQATLAPVGFDAHRKTTRRERFLAEMERVMPWSGLYRLIEPVYPNAAGPGRPRLA